LFGGGGGGEKRERIRARASTIKLIRTRRTLVQSRSFNAKRTVFFFYRYFSAVGRTPGRPMVDEAAAAGKRRRRRRRLRRRYSRRARAMLVRAYVRACVRAYCVKVISGAARCKRRGKRSVTCVVVSRSAQREFAHPFVGGG